MSGIREGIAGRERGEIGERGEGGERGERKGKRELASCENFRWSTKTGGNCI